MKTLDFNFTNRIKFISVLCTIRNRVLRLKACFGNLMFCKNCAISTLYTIFETNYLFNTENSTF